MHEPEIFVVALFTLRIKTMLRYILLFVLINFEQMRIEYAFDVAVAVAVAVAAAFPKLNGDTMFSNCSICIMKRECRWVHFMRHIR